MNGNLPHLMSRVFGTPLLIQQHKLEVILGVLAPRMGFAPPVSEAATASGTALERKPYEVTQDGIAIIPIEGTLVHKAYGLDVWSGMRSYVDLFSEVEDAATDPAIRGILLDIDSPGGEVAGAFDLADLIYAARSTKPLYAVANSDAFSAAYLLASAADQIFASRTSGLGSIGVIVGHLDESAADAKAGFRYTLITAGARKADFSSHEPLSPQARDVLEEEVHRVYNLFVATVTRNREMAEADVRGTEAGLFFGQDAVDAGLADQMGTRQDALNALRAAISNPNSMTGGQAMAQEKQVIEATEPRVTACVAAEQQALAQETKPEEDSSEGQAGKIEPQEETQSPTEKQAQPGSGPQPETLAPPTPDPAEALAKARADGYAQANEIVQLCMLAGMPAEASTLLKRGATVEQARKYLLERKAAAASLAGPEIESRILPGDGIKPSAESIAKGGPMDQAVDRLIATMKPKK